MRANNKEKRRNHLFPFFCWCSFQSKLLFDFRGKVVTSDIKRRDYSRSVCQSNCSSHSLRTFTLPTPTFFFSWSACLPTCCCDKVRSIHYAVANVHSNGCPAPRSATSKQAVHSSTMISWAEEGVTGCTELPDSPTSICLWLVCNSAGCRKKYVLFFPIQKFPLEHTQ